MRKSELKVQAEACSYIWHNLPQTRYCLFHVANEAQRSAIEWGQLKAAGFIKGIQDLMFFWDGNVYAIEVKSEGGKIDPWQKVTHRAHYGQGIVTYVFWNSEDIVAFVSGIVAGTNYDWESNISPYSSTSHEIKDLIRLAVISDCKRPHILKCDYCGWVK